MRKLTREERINKYSNAPKICTHEDSEENETCFCREFKLGCPDCPTPWTNPQWAVSKMLYGEEYGEIAREVFGDV